MIICPLDEVDDVDRAAGEALRIAEGAGGDLPGWGAELLVLQHPTLATVRFSCRCEGCHHLILTARFGRGLADAWFAVRGDLVDPADALA